MHTTSERAERIEQRACELRRQQQKRRDRFAVGLSAAISLLLVVVAALAMPSLMARQGFETSSSGAAASVFHVSSATGYVIISVLAFVLGCCVTILCYRLRRNREEHNGRNH